MTLASSVALVLALLFVEALPVPAQGAPSLSDSEASRLIESRWNVSAVSRWRIGQLVVIGDREAEAFGHDPAKGGYSEQEFRELQALEKEGLISISENTSFGKQYRPNEFMELASGIKKKVIATATEKGRTLARAAGVPESAAATWLGIRQGTYRVTRVIKNEPGKSAVHDYRVLMVTYDADWNPAYQNFSGRLGRPLSSKRKAIVLLRHNPFESQWKVLTWDVANATEDFSTNVVATAIGRIDALKDPAPSPSPWPEPASSPRTEGGQTGEPGRGQATTGPPRDAATTGGLLVLTVDGVDLEAMGPQFTKKFAGVFPTRTAYLRPVFQKLVGQEVPVTWLEWDGDLRRTPTLTEELANRIGRVIADAPGRRKVIAAHSWGGVLSYLALRRLEETGRIGPGGIDLLLTIHTPLAMPGPDSSAKIGADPARYGVKGTVNWYVKEEVRPLRSVRLWKNYFSAEDWLSGSIPAAQENMDTHLDHSASYLSPAMQAEYAKVIAGTRDASAGAVSATTPEVPRGDASQGATDGLAWVYGRWAGRIRQGLLSYPAIVTLRKDGAKLAGEMEYPSVPCRSRLTLVEARGEALVLTERVESGRCAGGSVVVRRSRDAGLLWEHVGATGKVLASGTLVRKEP